jgi:mono/diheme cytochrome c family protein
MISKLMSVSLGALLITGAAFGQDKKDPVAAGKEVFEQCSVCHNADSDEKKMGPGLKGLTKKAKMKNGKAPTDENVSAIIKAGGNGMPAYEDMLSKDELAQLMAYLKTL